MKNLGQRNVRSTPMGDCRKCRELEDENAALKAKLKNALRRADRDELTGLLRRGLMATLKRRIKRTSLNGGRSNSVGFIMIDINDMGDLNTAHGHPTIDKVVARLGGLIKRHIRQNDRAFRMTGDEYFTIVDCSEEAVRLLTARLARSVKRLRVYDASDRHVKVGVSIGASFQTGRGLDAKRLYEFTDVLLYRAKTRKATERCPIEIKAAA